MDFCLKRDSLMDFLLKICKRKYNLSVEKEKAICKYTCTCMFNSIC